MDEAAASDRPPPAAAKATASRGNPSLGDIVRSVVVLLALVGVIVAYQRFYTDDSVEFQAPVDVDSALAQARDVATYDVVGPAVLPAGWKATSVRYRPGSDPRWHVGYLTASQQYAGVEQGEGPAAELLDEVAPGAEPIGAADVSGDTWRVFVDDERDDTTLVRSFAGSVVVVTGSASQDELEQLAGALRTR